MLMGLLDRHSARRPAKAQATLKPFGAENVASKIADLASRRLDPLPVLQVASPSPVAVVLPSR